MGITDLSDGAKVQEIQKHLETFLRENSKYELEVESNIEWVRERKWALHILVRIDTGDGEYEFDNQMVINYAIDNAEDDDPETVAQYYGEVLLGHWEDMIEEGVSFNPLDDEEEDEVGRNPIN